MNGWIIGRVAGCMCLSLAAIAGFGQDLSDSVKTLEPVVVTATKSERLMGALPLPVTLVGKENIKLLGSTRLTEVLTEQTGLVVVPQVNGQGSGIQLQGFDPAYTLILVDGEPLVGRSTGTLELSRISVGNIKQIEIVKGPSSSLYGSEALAGVINIITEPPVGTKVNVSNRYGSNNTLDLNAQGALTLNRFGFSVFANRFSTSGYDLSPNHFGNTVSPFHNSTLSGKLTYNVSPRTNFKISGRWFEEEQQNKFEVQDGNDIFRTSGGANVKDWNVSSTLYHRFGNRVKSIVRFYASRYYTETNLNRQPDNIPFYHDHFEQLFIRPEITSEFFFSEKHITTAGAGLVHERVATSRYDDTKERQQLTQYVFAQHEWQPLENLSVIAGARYDYNSVFGSQFSPKLSTRWEVNPKITFKASMGVGFKAPDFRQLYLNFSNSAGGGYSVLGTEVVIDILRDLNNQGQIASYQVSENSIGQLEAERSLSFNVGANAKVWRKVSMELNIFRNTINNLIDSRIVAITTNNQNIYSFLNINRVFTQGTEFNAAYSLTPSLRLAVGYQLLFAKDRDVLALAREGNLFGRNPETFQEYRVKPSEYYGLYNRSRHTANLKLYYENHANGWQGSLRVIFRGRYGAGNLMGSIQGETIRASDKNGNAVQDVYDSFVSGFAVVNFSVAKSIKAIRMQVGIDNLFNYTEPVFIPNMPGRLFYTSLAFTWHKK